MIMYLNNKKFEYKEAKIILHIANEQFIVESNVKSFNEALEMLNELQYFSSETIKICSEAIEICSDGAIK